MQFWWDCLMDISYDIKQTYIKVYMNMNLWGFVK